MKAAGKKGGWGLTDPVANEHIWRVAGIRGRSLEHHVEDLARARPSARPLARSGGKSNV